MNAPSSEKAVYHESSSHIYS
ncbi:protein of unknown function [Cyanobium sp. NIES-981]|nr:protein of unknown function [Cyanobium sp. NIES-981]